MATDLAAGTELSGYRIESFVARGGMGVVYRATQLSLERPVALKLLAPELASEDTFRERFLREARLAAALDHPHVLPVYEAGEVDGVLFLALRYVEAEDLGRLLARGPLAAERARRIVCQLASALEAAHSRGLLHRDVKPQNVLLVGSGQEEHAYLTDFGVAKSLFGEGLTKSGEFVGSVDYLAPEQIEHGRADSRSDVYALGCLLYACLTGAPPFRREHEAATLWAHLNEPPPTGTAFDDVLARALAKDPAGRFQSAAELAAALSGETPTSLPLTRPEASALPAPATSFLGRERELVELDELLARDDVRLLTLTGPGGTGKTRLAIEAASRAAYRFPDGVVWVPLAPVRDPAAVGSALAQALGVTERAEVLIGEQRMLLLIDNFEHVVEAAPSLGQLLAVCPNVTLLVTSRETLRVEREREYQVPELSEPDAVAFFCARSGLQREPAIVELCRRLDAMPLALELAAARTKAFSPTQILDRLSARLDLLKGGRDADPRQQTLRATMQWSYELLSPEEQRLLARLSVFAGGCTLEAAEEVAGADPDTLQSLLEKNLLRRRETDRGPRYWMLETIRDFAQERLVEMGELDSTKRRLADFVLELASKLDASAAAGPELSRFASEQSNFREALTWAEQAGERDIQADLLSQTWIFWWYRADSGELLRWVESVVLQSEGERTLRRARVLAAGAMDAARRHEHGSLEAYAHESLAIARELGSPRETIWPLIALGLGSFETGDYDEAERRAEEAIGIARELGDRKFVAIGINNLGAVAMERRDWVRATPLIEEALELSRELGTPDEIALMTMNLAFCLYHRGRVTAAADTAREGLALARQDASLLTVDYGLLLLAALAGRGGDAEVGARLAGAAEALEDRLGQMLSGTEAEFAAATTGELASVLGDQRYSEALGEGKAMPLDEAVELALQVTIDELPLKTNLPTPATPFLGRERELVEVDALLAREDVSLLTLTGPGGTGKTRLAIETAARAAHRFPDGVAWVPLAPLRDPSLVTSAVAEALEVGEEPGSALVDTLRASLAGKRTLLLLDNLEHLLPAIAGDVAALAAGNGTVVLATSRERLQAEGEQVYAVPTLADEDAISLFLARARALDPAFEPDGGVAELCARLDNLPLAIELAAARTPLFTTAQLLERLSQRLDLLKARHDAEPRQQTLRATIEWSYDLLDEEEKRLFARLSVFVGGCTYEAAEDVCGADPDTLQSLLEQSLVRRRIDGAEQARYWMLETIREFAAERLHDSGEEDELRKRHAEFVLALAAEAEPELEGSGVAVWLERLDQDRDNIRAALTWLGGAERWDAQLDLVGRTGNYWWSRGAWAEARRWIDGALARAGPQPTASRAKALAAATTSSYALGDWEAVRAYGEEALAIFRELCDEGRTGWLLNMLGCLAVELGDSDEAERLFEDAVASARAGGDLARVALATGNLGELASLRGDHARALALGEESLAITRHLGRDDLVAGGFQSQALFLLRAGRRDEAAAAASESMRLCRVTGNRAYQAWNLVVCAAVEGGEDGARLLGAADAARESLGHEPAPTEAEFRADTEQDLRAVLGDAAYGASLAEGRELSLDEGVDLALQVLGNE